MNKFKMELTWHNCKSCPPEEDKNDFLIVTDGNDTFRATWDKSQGYDVNRDIYFCVPLPSCTLDDWWWADLARTVSETPQFKEINNG